MEGARRVVQTAHMLAHMLRRTQSGLCLIKPAGGTWQAQTITASGNMKHFSIWAYPAYMGTEEILFGSSSGRIFSRKHEIGTNALAAQTTIQLPSNTQDVIGFWCHDLNRGLAFTRAPAKIFTLTSTDPAHVSPPLSAALLAAPAQWPDLLNTQTDPALYAVNTIAFSDRAHGFIGGTYNNAGMTSNAGIARRVTDETGLYSNRMWYDPLGRVVLSQNSWQFGLSPKRYSYTRYDRLGPPYEAGEIGDQNNTFQSIFGEEVGGAFMPSVVDTTDLAAFLNNSANPKREVLRTFYDHAIPSNTFPIQQDHLRLRVASTTFQETYNSDPLVFDHATHYSYDIHGNVKQLVQDQPLMAADAQASVQRWKKLDYTYDLISGNVTEAAYQKGQLDQLTHRYSYDADNRITEVETSPNDMDWTRQARYFYYPHGPLQRTELGQQPVQGIDYAYTLQGWIRAVNSDLLRPEHDMGHDALAGDLNALTGRDAMGYSLQYHSGDYEAIDASAWASGARPMAVPGGNYQAATHDLFNGNIAAWTQSLQPFTGWTNTATDERGQVLGMAYRYDQLNRLKRANGFQDPGTDNDWTTAATTHANLYHSNYAYDANGNITKANRYDQSGSRYDSLDYFYHDMAAGRMQNRLYQLKDLAPDSAVVSGDGVEDLPFQNVNIAYQGVAGSTGNAVNSPTAASPGPNNFLYDALGRLKCDTKEEIPAITWTVASKVKQVDRTGSSSRKKLIFGYGAGGQRVTKAVLNNGSTTINTRDHYVHDAQGNLMAIYRYNGHNGTFTLMERPLYGSDRVGTDAQRRELMLQTQLDQSLLGTTVPPATPAELRYELKDHLGNVAATVSGETYPVDGNNDQVAEFLQPHLLSASGYEPFGSLLPGRNYSSSSYAYGFGGKRKDDEVHGATGTSYDFEARIQDPRVGRFLSLDPKADTYPSLSPYAFVGNSPLKFIDPTGRTIVPTGTDGSVNSDGAAVSAGFLRVSFAQVFPAGMRQVIESSWGGDRNGVQGWGNFQSAGHQADWQASFNAALATITDENVKVMALGVMYNITEGRTDFVYYRNNEMQNTVDRSNYAAGTMDSRYDFSKALYGVALNADRPEVQRRNATTGTTLSHGSGYLPIGILNTQGQEISGQGVSRSLVLTSERFIFGPLTDPTLETMTVANFAAVAGFRSQAGRHEGWNRESSTVDQSVKKVLDNILNGTRTLGKAERKALPPLLNPRQ